MRRLIAWMLRPKWIVNDDGEMGVRVWGVNFYYYKYDTPLIYNPHQHDDGRPMTWRYAWKREFGECVISRYRHKGQDNMIVDGL